ncbi:hypothetical protein [Shewanella algae]|uniref:hypothetical protein n=1 Tax=Shewanella algae TaxID=38313 RepID=UPI00118359CB|nr:hypothetical protein [Shewanella algae]
MNIDELRNVVAEQESNSCSECGKESKLHLTNSDGLENKLHFMGKIEPMTFLGKKIGQPYLFDVSHSLD